MGRTVPELTSTGGLRLRAWQEDAADAAVVLQAKADPLIGHYSPSISDVRTESDALRWLAARHADHRVEWAVEDESGVIGRTSLYIEDRDALAEVGYWVLPQARGRGVATMAVETVVGWAFTDGGLGRLEIEHELDNLASCAVAQRLGFTLEGTRRGGIVARGERHNVHLHALLASDVAQGRA